jgi:IS30 family transposase
MRSLAGQPALRRPGYKGYDEEVKETARTMAAQGMSKTEIAKILGVYRQTVVNWLDPEALKRHKERVRKYSAERRAERAKKKKEAAERAAERNAKRVGGALAEAYSLVHKLEAPLAIAAREATDPEVKRLLDDAIYQQHRTLYRIVAALGVS